MPATLDVSCPSCGKQLKVPAELEGKRVKCKECQEVFPVTGPKRAKPAAAAKPAAKPAPKAPPPPPPEEKPKSPFLDDDDDDVPGQAAKPMGVVHEEDIPRCPHCAKELDPPDAIICVHCGFNNQTRQKGETKKVIEAEATDWVVHLLPGIIALAIMIGLIVLDVICWINMSDWVEGSFLEKDEKNAVTGAKEYWVKPGAFTALIMAISLVVIIPAARFAFRRLALDYKPEEKVKK
jgi:hypothetical protein